MRERTSIFCNKFTNFSSNVRCSDFLPQSLGAWAQLQGHKGCINNCTFNSSGTRLLTGCDDGSVWLWDVGGDIQAPIARMRPHHTNVFTSQFLASNRIISGANDADVCVTEIGEGRTTTTKYSGHHLQKVVSSYVIDDSTFITCSYDATIRLFDTRMQYSRTEVLQSPLLTDDDYIYEPYERLLHDLEFYQLGPQGAGGGSINPTINGSCNESLLIDGRGPVPNRCFWIDPHPFDRKKFIVGCSGATIRMFDIRRLSFTLLSSIDHEGFCFLHMYGLKNATGVAYNHDGSKIAASIRGGYVHSFNTQDAKKLHYTNLNVISTFRNSTMPPNIQSEFATEFELYRPLLSIHTDKAVSWYGDYVLSGCDDGSLFLFDPATSSPVNVIPGVHRSNVNVVTVHPGTKMIATSGVDYFATLWRPTTITNIKSDEIKQRIIQTI